MSLSRLQIRNIELTLGVSINPDLFHSIDQLSDAVCYYYVSVDYEDAIDFPRRGITADVIILRHTLGNDAVTAIINLLISRGVTTTIIAINVSDTIINNNDTIGVKIESDKDGNTYIKTCGILYKSIIGFKKLLEGKIYPVDKEPYNLNAVFITFPMTTVLANLSDVLDVFEKQSNVDNIILDNSRGIISVIRTIQQIYCHSACDESDKHILRRAKKITEVGSVGEKLEDSKIDLVTPSSIFLNVKEINLIADITDKTRNWLKAIFPDANLIVGEQSPKAQ